MSHSQKAALRDEALKRRRAITPAMATAQAGAILVSVERLLPKGCRSVAGYAAVREEVSVWPLLASLHQAGITTALPCVPTLNQPLKFRAWHAGEPLVKGAFSVQEPASTAPLVLPEVLILPVAAFDRKGQRIGYGGGYYDRTLEQLRRQGLKAAIGIAYSVQEVKSVPAEPHDQKMDALVTELEVIRF